MLHKEFRGNGVKQADEGRFNHLHMGVAEVVQWGFYNPHMQERKIEAIPIMLVFLASSPEGSC